MPGLGQQSHLQQSKIGLRNKETMPSLFEGRVHLNGILVLAGREGDLVEIGGQDEAGELAPSELGLQALLA